MLLVISHGPSFARRVQRPVRIKSASPAETFTPAIFESLDERLDLMVDELLWWTDALKSARDADQ